MWFIRSDGNGRGNRHIIRRIESLLLMIPWPREFPLQRVESPLCTGTHSNSLIEIRNEISSFSASRPPKAIEKQSTTDRLIERNEEKPEIRIPLFFRVCSLIFFFFFSEKNKENVSKHVRVMIERRHCSMGSATCARWVFAFALLCFFFFFVSLFTITVFGVCGRTNIVTFAGRRQVQAIHDNNSRLRDCCTPRST